MALSNSYKTPVSAGGDHTMSIAYMAAWQGPVLEKDDPYNTRIHDGLPPTPICSPGLTSIYAALYPESTNYYYYALDQELGIHRFFTNDTEFNNFVASQNYS